MKKLNVTRKSVIVSITILVLLFLLALIDLNDFLLDKVPQLKLIWVAPLLNLFTIVTTVWVALDANKKTEEKWLEEKRLSARPYFVYHITPKNYFKRYNRSGVLDYNFSADDERHQHILLPLKVDNCGLGTGFITNVRIKFFGKTKYDFNKTNSKSNQLNDSKIIPKEDKLNIFYISFPKESEFKDFEIEIEFKDLLGHTYVDELTVSTENIFSEEELNEIAKREKKSEKIFKNKIIPKRIKRKKEPELKIR